MPVSTIDSTGLTPSGVTPASLDSNAQYTGFKNRIINGAMMIDQRNAGAAVTTHGQFVVDRWAEAMINGSASGISVQQSTTVPSSAGFTNSLSYTVGTGGSVGTSGSYGLQQRIEGYNFADILSGTANAKQFTLSFWVRSSITGTYGIAFRNSAKDRSYIATYSVSAANTWDQKSVTVTADTSGTWLTTNGIGLDIFFDLGTGSSSSTTANSWQAGNYFGLTGGVKLVETSGATFYITGVQLEKGSTATSFDYRPYGTELALCQRYCPVFSMGSSATNDIYRGFAATTTLSDYSLPLPVAPRTAPTGITTSGTFGVGNGAAGANATAIAFQAGGNTTLSVRATTTAGSPTLSQGVGTGLYGSVNGVIIATGCEL